VLAYLPQAFEVRIDPDAFASPTLLAQLKTPILLLLPPRMDCILNPDQRSVLREMRDQIGFAEQDAEGAVVRFLVSLQTWLTLSLFFSSQLLLIETVSEVSRFERASPCGEDRAIRRCSYVVALNGFLYHSITSLTFDNAHGNSSVFYLYLQSRTVST